MAAHRVGLRVILDRHAGRVAGQQQYMLRPASNARRVVQILPDGSYCLASFCEYGRRYIGSRLSLDELEKFLACCEPMPAGSRITRETSIGEDATLRPEVGASIGAPILPCMFSRRWQPMDACFPRCFNTASLLKQRPRAPGAQ
jgi:hypothetical protein